MKQKRELVRVVKKQDGFAAVDISGKQAGRGAYLCLDERCVEIARRQKRLERALLGVDCAGAYEELRTLAAAAADAQAAGAVQAAGAAQAAVVAQAAGAAQATGVAQAAASLANSSPGKPSDDSRRFYGLLGLAAKKGAIASGSDACELAARDGKAFLVILASDASDGTKLRFSRIASSYGIACIEMGEKAELGRHVGKCDRSALAVTDANFARIITGV